MTRRLLVCLSLAPTLGCVQDSGFHTQKEEVEAGDPDILVDPASLDVSGICGDNDQIVTITNDGLGILHVDRVSLDGVGWTMDDPGAPFEIEAGGSKKVTLHAEDGPGTLTIVSDDPDEGTYVMDLKADGNKAPVVTITSPGEGDVIEEESDVILTGTILDDLDLPVDIAVEWSSDLDGVLTSGTGNPDGSTNFTWTAQARTMGPQTITLTATDTCGDVGTYQVTVCQAGIASYDALGLTGWHFEGTALYDETNGWLQLTDNTTLNQVGTAFETSEQVDASLVNIDFYVYMGDGTGADGISLTALDTTRMDTFLGGNGCGIGYGGGSTCTAGPALPGWSIEFDTFKNNEVDTTERDHIAFTFDGDLVSWEAYVPVDELEDNGWHHVVVDVVAPHVTVTIDDVTWIDQDFEGNFEFPAYVGFTAGTGQATNYHWIDALQVTDDVCD
ncbi:MAG: hypothetical protein ACOZNI_33030 [Myxococcota bacterium]